MSTRVYSVCRVNYLIEIETLWKLDGREKRLAKSGLVKNEKATP